VADGVADQRLFLDCHSVYEIRAWARRHQESECLPPFLLMLLLINELEGLGPINSRAVDEIPWADFGAGAAA
jgi:hypothetical protein